jgi:hypothetical protein
LQKEIDITKRKQQDFLEKNSDIIGLIKNNDIAKYDELNQELADVSKNVAKQEEIYATLDRFSKEEEELKKKSMICKKTLVIDQRIISPVLISLIHILPHWHQK